ncbi:hypothetical protein BX070DRAFT_193224, partial [Coemansia spiralis]
SAGCPSARTSATRCSSPPESFCTSLSIMLSMFIGLTTSVWNCGCMNIDWIFLSRSIRTVPLNLGAIICGLYDTLSCGMSTSSPWSGFCLPASMLISVVLPVPFSPSKTTICESVNEPCWTVSLKSPSVLLQLRSISWSSICSTMRKVSASSRKRIFSVGILPARNTLIPSRTE